MVLKCGLLDNFTTPSKSRAKAGVGTAGSFVRYEYSDDFRRSEMVLKCGLLYNFNTPSKSRVEAGVVKRDDFFNIHTPTIFAEAEWY